MKFTVTKVVSAAFKCDAEIDVTGVAENHYDPEPRRRSHPDEEHAAAAGWSCWVNRGERHYCPRHGPSEASNMRRVW